MTSNVGSSGVYEAGDQRNQKDSEIRDAKKEDRFEEGKENSHVATDSSMWPRQLQPLSQTPLLYAGTSYNASILMLPTEDQRSIANRLASAEKVLPR